MTVGPAVDGTGLALDPVRCAVCGADAGVPVAVGEDFEYRSSADTFLAVRCSSCGLVYLNPRPSATELARIYPPSYHAFDFSPARYGLAYRVRAQLEARRARRWCRGLRADARVLDVGCGDGFHLKLLRDFGRPGLRLEGVDVSERAVIVARAAGLVVHQGAVESLPLEGGTYDLVLLVATIEHVAAPAEVLAAARRLLHPGGRVVIVTDNTATPSFRLFHRRHWGGYHFPRHWNLFDEPTLRRLASGAGLEVEWVGTAVSPVNWVYSVRNALVDYRAPPWLVERFSLSSPVSLAAFTLVDALFWLAGRGTLIEIALRRPAAPESGR